MFRIIRESVVKKLLSQEKAFQLAEEAFRMVWYNQTRMPPKIYLELPGLPSSDFRAMPAFIQNKKKQACGMK